MKCIICHSDNIQEKSISEGIHVGADIVEVPITTLVCLHCGERYYDPSTMRYLDAVEEELHSGHLRLPETGKIFAYPNAAAV